jgi:UDP-N-acetyl-D-galactosamine dehydrogenase
MKKIAIIGLGYVGLPLAVEFGKIRQVIGYDVNKKRVAELKNGYDRTLECTKEEIKKSEKLKITSLVKDITEAQIYILTVPTPVDNVNRPDLKPIIKATEEIAKILKIGDIVIYESTVYPGATEEICVPILEKISRLKYNIDFYCGYSPERINPGDKIHNLTNIKKITSGSTKSIANEIDEMYAQIIKAGTHKTSSIKIAEAAKVIENTQRDINIALMNELSLLFNKLDIDTIEVINAAATKWNFINFRPGLVGGHCIGVDPYYLTYKAQEVGYHPEIILAGRRINDSMPEYIADETIKIMLQNNKKIFGSKILIMGLTFKENCPDIRNTKVIKIIKRLKEYKVEIDIYDPWVNREEVREEFKLECLERMPNKIDYSAIIIAVGHKEFVELNIKGLKNISSSKSVIIDVKGIYPKKFTDFRL